MTRYCGIAAGLHGLTGIIIGAFGAHGLKASVASLPPEEAARILGWVETGSRYQLAHAAALLGLAALGTRLPPRPRRLAALGLTWGTAIFSATLYAMAFGAPHWLGAVTPVGGLLMLLGWGALTWGARGLRDAA